ncbi:WD repeat-containing protein 88-like isoform X2 [Pristis pectinata]|uniref:WD repeat-containing protein 88-like isoform X2 n=1 Tax=Pristis pectinata TaxID=685728 RepID=UPI00223C9AF3|nr:WD repeat-containing protein 88-like isoform X2 [Pristis pectinata]
MPLGCPREDDPQPPGDPLAAEPAESGGPAGSREQQSLTQDVSTGAHISVFGLHTAPVTECCLSPDNQRLFTSSWDKSLKAWDVETRKVLWAVVHCRPLTCCDVSFDGKHVVCGSDIDNTVHIREAESGTTVLSLRDQHSSTVTRCRFSPDGQRVASTSCDCTARIWDVLAHRTTLSLQRHSNVVSDCCFTQPGNTLCTASWDRTLLIWDVSAGQFRSRGPLRLAGGHEGCISSCAVSKDANLIVAGSYDQTISIWDTTGLYRKLVLKDHHDWVTDVAISADNKWVLSACKDSTVRLWNIERLDHIPAVKSQRKLYGEKFTQCTVCGKLVSVCLQDVDSPTRCLFCQLSATQPDVLPRLPDPGAAPSLRDL